MSLNQISDNIWLMEWSDDWSLSQYLSDGDENKTYLIISVIFSWSNHFEKEVVIDKNKDLLTVVTLK